MAAMAGILYCLIIGYLISVTKTNQFLDKSKLNGKYDPLLGSEMMRDGSEEKNEIVVVLIENPNIKNSSRNNFWYKIKRSLKLKDLNETPSKEYGLSLLRKLHDGNVIRLKHRSHNNKDCRNACWDSVKDACHRYSCNKEFRDYIDERCGRNCNHRFY